MATVATETSERIQDTEKLKIAERLKAKDISPFIGSVIGLSKKDLMSGEYAADLRALIERRGVLVFPQFNPTDEEQIQFTRTLGTFALEMRGEKVFKITLDKGANSSADYLRGSLYWHVDGTMNKVPVWLSLLSSKVLSPTGGNTEFCNTYAAWEQLPEPEKKSLEGLRVMHSAWTSLFYYDPEPSYAHLKEMIALGENELPLVWRHRSGRKSLVLGCTAHHVIGMSARESTELLVRLREWATQPRFTYCHKWALGDMVMWDNTGSMHRATPYPPDCGRLLHRTLLKGEEPFA
ncbi:MAG TPA: TauD/TfdA family dioxygenase [Steroidobacteraceae bacterium]|nr:TauD/TfdA family dioxygenase [Steroidobacteraceae bacterium]